MKIVRCILVFVFISGGLLFAASDPKVQEDVVIEGTAPMEWTAKTPEGLPREFLFISAEMEDAGKIVKGAPYSAEAVTERTQSLADGNRIVHKSTAKLFRDSEGRTRREQQLTTIGNWKAAEDPPRTVFIQDPVANVHYVLEPENQIARKMDLQGKGRSPAPPHREGEFDEFIAPHPMPPGDFGKEIIRYRITEKDAKTESLGKQTMEGIPVDGTRTTITISAGEMGNELPIQIISERWYSPDLQTDIMTRHSDPRFGETVYQLTHISRAEQNRSLFEVPRGYKVENAPPPPHRMIHREIKQN